MTTIVSLFAGPGAGKSTIAAKTFARLKEAGANVELVTEYVKQWAWDGRKPCDFDQFLFFGKQVQRESRLLGKVDVVITDAPVLLTAYYAQVFGSPSQAACFRQMLLVHRSMLREQGHTSVDVWLDRAKPYDARGRFQDEAGAKKIDTELQRYLTELGLAPTVVLADENAAETIQGEIK